MQFWVFGVFRACVCAGYLANSVCIYRQEALCFTTIQNLNLHVVKPLLVFEANMTNIFPKLVPCYCRVVEL